MECCTHDEPNSRLPECIKGVSSVKTNQVIVDMLPLFLRRLPFEFYVRPILTLDDPPLIILVVGSPL